MSKNESIVEVFYMTQTLGANEIELDRVRLLHETQQLRHFVSRNITWELLLVIYELEGIGDYGINDYIDKLQTMKTTRLTIQNFVKDRINEGSLIVTSSNKKSRKTLLLSQKLRDELEAYFQWTTRINNSGISTIRKEKVNRPNLNGALQDERI
jgi:hypothetical protein